nr:actin-depolymerizing factor 7 [Quercus suber]
MDVSDECNLKFLELIAKSNSRFIIFKVENQEVMVEKLGIPDEAYEDFTASQPASERSITVFNFDFITDQNFQKSHLSSKGEVRWSMPAPRIDSRVNWMEFKLSCKQQILVK